MGQGNPYIGAMILFAGNFAPRGWAFCEGQLLAISQNTALFSLIGTIYGGDGRTTFALPDLRGRGPISSGTGPGLPFYREGARGGTPTVTLNQTQLPSHFHFATDVISGEVSIGVSDQGPDTDSPNGANLAKTSGNVMYNEEGAASGQKLADVSSAGLTNTITVNPTGGSQYHNNMQPYLAINYIIALQGVFPSRS